MAKNNNKPFKLSLRQTIIYLALGIYFGIIISKSEAISWFRIQEMFRFHSFHMYGLLMGGVVTAAFCLKLIRSFGIKNIDGEAIEVPPKETETWKAYLLGGACFGIGWAFTGACPGPLYTLVGTGMTIMLVPLFFALVGAWTYGYLRPKLPH
ncbi:MAG: YeeE/YedE family protein [bacterium]|nr:YeeE/YedE family protein [bacterium]